MAITKVRIKDLRTATAEELPSLKFMADSDSTGTRSVPSGMVVATDFTGAGEGKTPKAGLVPKPGEDVTDALLCGDGTWKNINLITKDTIDALDWSAYKRGHVRIGENVYETVEIDGLVWLASNLREQVGTYSEVTGDPQYSVDRYGYLYSYDSKSDIEAILPSGWRLPTGSDWTRLMEYAGGASVANLKLKATTDWKSGDGSMPGNDEYGFTLLPASTDGSGLRTYMWSVPDGTKSSNRWSADWDGASCLWYTDGSSYKRPWRLVKDAT